MKRPKLLFVSVCVVIASCLSNLYSKPIPNHTDDISTLSEAFVKATRAGVLDFTAVIPGKVYHPRDGYISYERLWCMDDEKGSLDEYLQFMEEVCELKGGAVEGEWCVSQKTNSPLFSATIEQDGTSCTTGDLTTIIHTIEPIYSPTVSEWLETAETFGFRQGTNEPK